MTPNPSFPLPTEWAVEILYPGALFLAGGEIERAELLLIQAINAAAGSGSSPEEDRARAWLEAFLVRAALEGTPPEPEPAQVPFEAAALPDLAPEDLLRGARAVPAWARPALWLVLVRAWGYAESERALGVSRATLRAMLAYRHELVRAVLARGDAVDGSQGASA